MTFNWIPINQDDPETFPTTDDYIMLSFENWTLPAIGRFDISPEGGAFYLGDEDKPCVHYDMIVNAWAPMIDPYRG